MDEPTPNTAVRTLVSMCLRWNAHAHATDMLADDFIRVDRRPGTAMPDADRNAFAAVERSMWALGASWPSTSDEYELIEQIGDHLVMAAGDVGIGDAGASIPYVIVAQSDAGGLVRRIVLFAPEQRADAREELYRLAAEPGR